MLALEALAEQARSFNTLNQTRSIGSRMVLGWAWRVAFMILVFIMVPVKAFGENAVEKEVAVEPQICESEEDLLPPSFANARIH